MNESAIEMPVRSNPPLIFIVDGSEFTAAVEKAVKDRRADDRSTDDAALDPLVTVVNKNPEMCVSIDKLGNMSVWALENVGTTSLSNSRSLALRSSSCRILNPWTNS